MMKSNIVFFFLAFLCFLVCYPVIFILTGSLMDEGTLLNNIASVLYPEAQNYAQWSFIPDNWSIESYKTVFLYEPGFFTLFWNSVKICCGILIGHIIFAVPCSYGFAMYDFKCKNFLFTLYIVFMMMPFQVLMLPQYMVLKELSLLDTMWAVILPGVFSTFPVFIMYNFFKGIPRNIIEAPRLDGADELMIFLRIGIPSGMSGIAASMVIQFLEYWNMVEQPMIFIESTQKWPLGLYIPSISIENLGVSFVAAFVSLIPSVLIFRLGQDSLEAGITATTFKR